MIKKVICSVLLAHNIVCYRTDAFVGTIGSRIKTVFTTNPILYIDPDNIHVVSTLARTTEEEVPLVRTAQLSAQRLEEVVRIYHIKSILNLRNPYEYNSPLEQPWYSEEKAKAAELNLTYVTIPLETRRAPSHDELAALFHFFEKNHPPFLVHCKAGADRSGLVAALFILEVKYGKGGERITDRAALQEALAELVFSSGHYRLFHPALRAFINDWFTLRTDHTRKEALELWKKRKPSQHFDITHFFSYLSRSE